MPKVLSYTREGSSSRIEFENNGSTALWLLVDGMLEAYMEAYGLMPGQAFSMILLDICDDSVDVPPYMKEGMREVVDSILLQSDSIEWSEDLDRNEVLAQITVSKDTAPELVSTWRNERERAEEVGAAYQRRQEELLADEYMGTYKEPLPTYQMVGGKLVRV